MGWLNQDDIKPYKRLFKQQETKGSLMGRGLNPPVKYKAYSGFQVPLTNNTWQGGIGFGANVQSLIEPSKYSLANTATSGGAGGGAGGGGIGGFLKGGLKALPGVGNILSGVGGIMQGYGAYQQAKGQQKALGHAIGQAKKIPGMIEESYAPGLERYGDLETQYGHQGAVHQSLMRNLTGAFNQQIGQVDPSMRKMLSRGNVQKGVQAMEQMLPAFAQQQQNIAGTLTGMEQQKGQELIGAHENLAQLQAARKSINPTASALGSFGASLMSMVQGGGKVKKQGGDETYTPYSSYDAGKQIINEELIKKGYTAENYPEIAGIIKSNRMNNPGEVSDELRNRPVSPSDIAGYLGTNIESSSEDSIYNQNIRGTSAYEDIYEKKIKATIPQLDDEYGWYDTVRQKDTGGTYGKRTEYDEDFAPIIGGTPMLEGVTVSAPRKKADGGYISGPHHGAGGVDISPNVEAQGGEFVVNANSYNKHKSSP